MVSRLLLIVLASITAISEAYANTCDAYFPDVVQGHADNSTIGFTNQGRIMNPISSALAFDNLEDNSNNGNEPCSINNREVACTVTGVLAPSFGLPDFQTTTDGGNLTYPNNGVYNQTVEITDSDIQTLIIQRGARATFISNNSPFKINSAIFRAESIVTLQSGSYWFNELTIESNAKVYIEGPVTIYVNGELVISEQGELNYDNRNGEAKDLTIMSWSTISLSDNAKVKGVVYGKTLEMRLQSQLTGAISVENKLTVFDNAKVYYEDVSGAICELPPALGTPIFSPSDGIMGGQLNTGNASFDIGVAGYTVGDNNWPNNEGPEHIIDGVGQKHLNFGKFNTGAIISPDVGCSAIDTIKFWTANDAEGRDPTSYKLYGTNTKLSGNSHSMSLFTLIAEGDIDLPSSRNSGGNNELQDSNSQTLSFANNTIYSSYLLFFPTVKNQNNTNTDNSMQLGEVQTYGSIEACLAPVAEYRFDEENWTGINNNVLDNTPNQNHGTAAGDANTLTDGKVCRAGTFGGSGYVNVNDINTYLSSTSSLAFWIKTTQKGNNTAWQAPGILGIEQRGGGDDIFWGYIDKSGRIRMKKGNGRDARSKTKINNDSWHHVVLTWDSATGEVQVFVNGNLEDSDISESGDVTNEFSYIGRIKNSFNNTYFTGELDELLIYDSVISADTIRSIYNNQLNGNNYDGSPRVCPATAINHYEIIHDGVGLTCAAESIVIKACMDIDGTCSTVAPEDVTITLVANSPSGTTSIWSENPITIPGNSTGGYEVLLSHPIVENVSLSIENQSNTVCNGAVSANCNIAFVDSGFIFDVPKQTSCETSQKVIISAVRKDITSEQCVPNFRNVTKTLKFWTEYDSPTTGTKGLTLTHPAVDLPFNPENDPNSNELPVIEGLPIQVIFDTNGESAFNVTYPDAGRLTLNASHDGTGNDAGLRMIGADKFVTVPAQLTVKSSDAGADCATDDANCSRFKAANEDFNLTVSASCADDTVTPNFQMNNIGLSLTEKAPDKGNPVSLGIQSIDISATDQGEHTEANQTISEVGVFRITATLPSGGYLGETILPVTSDSIGRFTPAYYQLGDIEHGVFNQNDPFVYTGEMTSKYSATGKIAYTLLPEYTITAKSFTNNTTLNYTGNFIKLVADDVVRTIPTTDAIQLGKDLINNVDLAANLSEPVLAELTPGVLKYQFNNTDHYVYTRNSNALINPFTAAIHLQIDSIEDEDFVSAVDYDAVASNGILTLKPQGVDIRFGRWIMENSYGTETSEQRIPMQVQYWENNEFVLNSDDSFTTFVATDASVTENNLSPTSPNPLLSGSDIFTLGKTNKLTIQSPGAGIRGSVFVEFDVPSWLKFDWIEDADGNYDNSYDDNPSSQVNFGLFRGNDRIIYRQEVFD